MEKKDLAGHLDFSPVTKKAVECSAMWDQGGRWESARHAIESEKSEGLITKTYKIIKNYFSKN